jgi:hypothetical protein
MENSMKDLIKMGRSMVKEKMFGLMGNLMKGLGKMAICMDSVSMYGQMLKNPIKLVKSMSMKDSGNMVLCMAKEREL